MTDQTRSALDVIAELRRGVTATTLTEKLQDLIAACVDTGKKGELVLKLTVEPDKDDENRMKVTDLITVKTPLRPQKPSLFFLDGGHNLVRTDPGLPGQMRLPGTDDTAGDDLSHDPDTGEKAAADQPTPISTRAARKAR